MQDQPATQLQLALIKHLERHQLGAAPYTQRFGHEPENGLEASPRWEAVPCSLTGQVS